MSGRVEPVPIVNKQDSGGIGRLEMEVKGRPLHLILVLKKLHNAQLEQVKEVSQHRRVLEVEKEDSEERRQKFKVTVFQIFLCTHTHTAAAAATTTTTATTTNIDMCSHTRMCTTMQNIGSAA